MKSSASRIFAALLGLGLAAACRQQMAEQPRYEPLAKSDFFADGRASRPLVPGTVARGQLHEDTLLHEGRVGGEVAAVFPFPVTREVIERGRERFDIFCSPCHGRVGDGKGMVVRRGFPEAQSLHIDRLRAERAGYFFDVVTNGFGRMQGYAAQVPVRDRWAIVAYVRVLQRSRHATIEDVPADERARLVAEKGGSR
jgi:hypothetical protein